MRPTLAAIASIQGGLFTRQQALDNGYTPREVKALTRPDGDWATVLPGTYCRRELLMAHDARQRWLLRDRAAASRSTRPCVLSHDSAARVLDVRMLEVTTPGVHLTHIGDTGSRRTGLITRHHDQLPLCVEVIDDLVSTTPARTALDIGRLHGYQHGLVAIDGVRNTGVPLGDLDTDLKRMSRHPHIARAEAALRDSDAGSESVLETLGRQLIQELDIGDVETQFPVELGEGRTAYGDLRIGRHIFECDSMVKLVGVAEGGVATRPAAEVVFDQQKRLTQICAAGFGASRIYWSDVVGTRSRRRAKDRLLREYEVTRTRFGTELSADLRTYADEHPRRLSRTVGSPDDNPDSAA